MPEESDATRAINAAASVLLAFFDSAPTRSLRRYSDRAPRSSRPTDDTVAATARGEDAAAALFGNLER